MLFREIFFICFGYLLGSILFARLFGLLFAHKDITQNTADGNPGTANAFLQGGFSPESPDQIAARFPKVKNFKQVLESLVNTGKLVRVEEKILLHADYYNKALTLAKEHVDQNGQITLAEMRDLMGASRKFAVAVLEYWDKRGITKKVGDARTFK